MKKLTLIIITILIQLTIHQQIQENDKILAFQDSNIFSQQQNNYNKQIFKNEIFGNNNEETTDIIIEITLQSLQHKNIVLSSLQLVSSQNPLKTVTNTSYQQLLASNVIKIDEESFLSRNNQHSYKISKEELDNSLNINIGIFKIPELANGSPLNENITYDIKIYLQNEKKTICPYDCNKNQLFNNENVCIQGQCQCQNSYYVSFVGQNCQIMLQNPYNIGYNEKQDIQIQPYQTIYFKLKKTKTELKKLFFRIYGIDYEKSGYVITNISTFSQPLDLVNTDSAIALDNQIQFSNDSNESKIINFKTQTHNDGKEDIYMGIHNLSGGKLNIEFQVQNNDTLATLEETLKYTIFFITLFLGISVIIISCFRYRKYQIEEKLKEERIRLQREQQQNQQNQTNRQNTQDLQRSRVQNQQVLNQQQKAKKKTYSKLTQKIIDGFFPSQPYEEIIQELKQDFEDLQLHEQSECAVCLCDFEKDEKSRMTICLHIFHDECLVSWLNKKENCPVCRNNLDRKALIQYSESIKKEEKEKEQQEQSKKQIEKKIVTNKEIPVNQDIQEEQKQDQDLSDNENDNNDNSNHVSIIIASEIVSQKEQKDNSNIINNIQQQQQILNKNNNKNTNSQNGSLSSIGDDHYIVNEKQQTKEKLILNFKSNDDLEEEEQKQQQKIKSHRQKQSSITQHLQLPQSDEKQFHLNTDPSIQDNEINSNFEIPLNQSPKQQINNQQFDIIKERKNSKLSNFSSQGSISTLDLNSNQIINQKKMDEDESSPEQGSSQGNFMSNQAINEQDEKKNKKNDPNISIILENEDEYQQQTPVNHIIKKNFHNY